MAYITELLVPRHIGSTLSEFMLEMCPACAPCGLRGCKNWPAPFPGRMSYKAT